MNRSLGRGQVIRSRKRQVGAETVETALTLVLFFFLLFTILDFAIGVYDQGVVATASRVGARQGSLYWIDPSDYDASDIANNVRIKEDMIDSAVEFYLSLLMRPGADVPTPEYRVYPEGFVFGTDSEPAALNTNDLVCCSDANCDVKTCVSRASVGVDVDYPYSGFSAVPWVPDLPLRAVVGSPTEPDL